MIPDLGRALIDGIESLEAVDVRYAMVGGLAVSAWATPRATGDADLYAELAEPVRGALEQQLVARGFHVPAMREELERFGVFRSRSPAGIFLDIFDSAGPLGKAILDRRREVDIEGRKVWTIAPEELVILKLFSERGRDFDDVVTLLRDLGSSLDMAYVKGWAAKLDESIGGDDVSERVRRAIAAAKVKADRRR
jgi:Nucleotidyl transferase of unknown function (DUF2204)